MTLPEVTRVVFLSNTASDVSGYKRSYFPPWTPTTEATLTGSGAVGDGDVLIKAWASGVLGLTSWPAGTWTFNFFASVSDTADTTQVKVKVYQRTAAGAETLLFTATSAAIKSLTSIDITFTYAFASPTTTAVTDRLVVKVYHLTNSSTSKTTTVYFEGVTHQSHIITPFDIPVYGNQRHEVYDPGEEGTAAGGSGTPATTVQSETSFGISPAVGTSTNYAREDHTHGSPTAPGGSGGPGADFDVSSVTSGMTPYYKASVGVTYDATTLLVSQVNDQETSYNMTQGTDANKPPFIPNTNLGWPGITFDGVNSFLSSSAVPATGANPRTLYIVLAASMPLNFTDWHCLMAYGDTDPDKEYAIYQNVGVDNTRNISMSYWGTELHTPVLANMAPCLLMAIYDGSIDRIYFNNALVGKLTIALNTASAYGLVIGSRINAPTDMGCFVACEWGGWNKALSDAQRNAIAAGLKTKYGLPLL